MAGHVHVRDIRRPVGAEVFAASLVFQHHVVGWGKALGLEVEGQLWRNVRLSGLRRIWLIDPGVGRVRPIERVIFRVAPGRGEQVVIGPGRVEMVLKSCPEELGVVFRIADDVQAYQRDCRRGELAAGDDGEVVLGSPHGQSRHTSLCGIGPEWGFLLRIQS